MVIQPKNISPDGYLYFGPDEPLRTDLSQPKQLAAGDVLLVSRGRFSAVVFDRPESESWIASSSILILTDLKNSVMPEYVACYFNSAGGQKMFRRYIEQSTISFISTAKLAEMDIPVPPVERQKALIALDKTTRDYARLTDRKQELQKQILDYTLETEIQSIRRRTR